MAKEKWGTYKYPARFGSMYEFRRKSKKGHPEEVEVSNIYTMIFFLIFAGILTVGVINFING